MSQYLSLSWGCNEATFGRLHQTRHAREDFQISKSRENNLTYGICSYFKNENMELLLLRSSLLCSCEFCFSYFVTTWLFSGSQVKPPQFERGVKLPWGDAESWRTRVGWRKLLKDGEKEKERRKGGKKEKGGERRKWLSRFCFLTSKEHRQLFGLQ